MSAPVRGSRPPRSSNGASSLSLSSQTTQYQPWLPQIRILGLAGYSGRSQVKFPDIMQLNLGRSNRLVPDLQPMAPNIPPNSYGRHGVRSSGDPDLDI